jgi:hypothetical protein
MKKHLLPFIKFPSGGFRKFFLLLSLCGTGGFAFAQSHINIELTGATYTETPDVKFRVSWSSIPQDGKTRHSKIWVMVDYRKVEQTQPAGSWTRATVAGVSPGTVDAGGKGFWLQGGSSYNQEVTARLSGMPDRFVWCVHVSDYPPNAEMISTGGYVLHGTPPFNVRYDGVRPNATNPADSNLGCIIALSDATHNPAGIIPAPPAVATTNPAPRCGDGAVTLTATAGGGTTTANTYTWKIGAAAATTTTANTYSLTVNAGSSTYSVTVTNANHCTGAAATGTITATAIPPVPGAPTQDGPKCAGTPITFSASAPSGATGLDWTGSVSGQGDTRTTSTTAGNYSARVRSFLSSGGITCYSDYSPATEGTITALPPVPNAPTQDGPKCAGTAITFRASVPSGATGLDWTGSVSGQGDTRTTPTTAGNYSARVRSFLNSGGITCYSEYSPATEGTITAIPPVPNAPTQDGPKCAGTPITFWASVPSGATDLEWTGSVSGTGTSKQTNSSAGNYSAQVRSFLNSGGITCYSGWSGNTQGTIDAPAGEGQRINACGCAGGLKNCNSICMPTCCTDCAKWTNCSGFTFISLNPREPVDYGSHINAVNFCNKKAEGWRLPTIDELKCICMNKDILPGGYHRTYYWSSSYGGATGYYYSVFMDSYCTAKSLMDMTNTAVKCVW